MPPYDDDHLAKEAPRAEDAKHVAPRRFVKSAPDVKSAFVLVLLFLALTILLPSGSDCTSGTRAKAHSASTLTSPVGSFRALPKLISTLAITTRPTIKEVHLRAVEADRRAKVEAERKAAEAMADEERQAAQDKAEVTSGSRLPCHRWRASPPPLYTLIWGRRMLYWDAACSP